MKKRLLAVLLIWAVIFADMAIVAEAMAVHDATAGTTEEASSEKESQNSGQFLVKINYGIDSLVSYSGNTPVQVVITNQGEDFTGELTLTVVREYGKNYGYSNDISIPSGTTKSSFLTISGAYGFDNCVVRILDEDGHIVYERTIMNQISFNTETIIGVLSDDYAALNYLDGMTIPLIKNGGVYDLRMGQMTEETMPDISSALGTCKIIVIDNYDTSKLSDAQYQALRQWVENGGLLIVGTGSEHNKTLSKFKDDFLSGSVGSLSKKSVPMVGLVNAQYTPTSDDMVPSDDIVTTATEQELPEETQDGEDTQEGESTSEEKDASEGEDISEGEDASEEEAAPEEQPDGYNETSDNMPMVPADSSETLDLDILDLSVDGGEPVESVAGGELFIEKQVGIGKVIVCKTALGMEPFSGYDYNINVIAGMLNAVMTTDIISVFNGSNGSYDGIYLSSYVVDKANGAMLPKATKYMVLFIIYIILVGPAIYLLLKWKDKSKMLWVAIPVVAVIFTAGVYVVSINDTVRNPILTSYSVERYEDASKTTVTAMSVVNPRSKAYEVNLNGKYTDVRPLDNDYYYGNYMFRKQAEATCLIKEKVDHTVLKFDKAQAFTKMYMQAVANEATEQNIDMNIMGYRDGFTGTVTNRLDCDLRHVVVYVGGYGSYFERIPAGETVEIKKDSSQISMYDIYSLADQFLAPNAYSTDRKNYNKLNDLGNVLSSTFYGLQPGEGFVIGFKDNANADVSSDKRVVEYSEIVAYKSFEVKYADVKGKYSSNIHNDYLENATYSWDIQAGYSWDYAENEVSYDFGDDGINTLYYIGVNANYNNGLMEADCYIWNPETGDWDRIFVDKDEEVKLAPYFIGENGTMILLKFVPNGMSNDGIAIPTIAGGEN